MKKKFYFPREKKQSAEDPIIFTLYPGSREEPMSETINKILAALKIKYKNTYFYGFSDHSGTQIKLKLREYGGQIVPITEPTLRCVREFTDAAFKKL